VSPRTVAPLLDDPKDISLGLGARLRAIAQRKKDSSPPEPLPVRGRDPLVHRGTEKARFFKGDWRNTWPHEGSSTSARRRGPHAQASRLSWLCEGDNGGGGVRAAFAVPCGTALPEGEG